MKFIIPKFRPSRINIFDLSVITIVLLVLGTFLWLRMAQKNEWISLRVMVTNDEWWWQGNPPQFWYADNLRPNQQAYNSFGEKVAEITNVESFDVGAYTRRLYVDVQLKGAYDKKRKIYLYNFQPLQIGKPIDLTFGKNNVRGLITYINDPKIDYTKKKIEVTLRQVRPWVAGSYLPGMEMKDSLGRVLARIDSAQTTLAQNYDFSDIRGKKILVVDPDYRDVTLQLTIATFRSGDTAYFIDRAAIKIGEKIWFQFPNAAIRDAEITKILE